jgi:hypothetical protein
MWEFHEALLDADSFEDLPGKSQAAILEAEHNRPICASSAARRLRCNSAEHFVAFMETHNGPTLKARERCEQSADVLLAAPGAAAARRSQAAPHV